MKRSMLAGMAALIALASSAYVQRSGAPSSEPAARTTPAAPISVVLTPIARDGTPVGEARRVQLAPVAEGELDPRSTSETGM